MKDELKQSAVRHSHRLIDRISQVIDVPEIVADSIRREIEYATMDGYRITMRNATRNGGQENAGIDP